MNPPKISRREFLRFAGLGAFALVGSRLGAFGRPVSPYRPLGLKRALAQMDMEPFTPDAEVSITAAEKFVQILPGAQTRVWSYVPLPYPGT